MSSNDRDSISKADLSQSNNKYLLGVNIQNAVVAIVLSSSHLVAGVEEELCFSQVSQAKS